MGDHGDITSSEVPLDAQGRTYHLCVDAKNLAKKIFIVGDPARAKTVANHFDEITFETSNREYNTITGTYKGERMTVMSTGIGTDNVEIALVELHILNEYDIETKTWKKDYDPLTIIRIGTCGSPQEDIKVGAMAITSYGFGLDNTGAFYPYDYNDPVIKNLQEEVAKTDLQKANPYFSKASSEVVKALEEAAKNIESGRSYATGVTSAASGFYGPQGRIVGRLSNILIPDMEDLKAQIKVQGPNGEVKIINNEMEASLMNRLCNILGYRSAGICSVLAARAEGKQEFISNEDYTKSVEDCTQVALEAMLKL